MADEGIGSAVKIPYHHNFGDNTSNLTKLTDYPGASEPRVEPLLKKTYKVTYPASLDGQIKRLRVSLDLWKEIVLPVKRVLLWEKNWHPTALVGGMTILFTLIWLLDPSMLTIVATLGLMVTICDYFLPSIAGTLFKSDKWNSTKEAELEELCASIILYKTKFELLCGSYSRLRTSNPKMYIILTVGVLAMLAWLGCIFNNLFLMYITLTFLLLVPGLEHHGMLVRFKSSARTAVASLLDNAKTKISDTQSNLTTSKKVN